MVLPVNERDGEEGNGVYEQFPPQQLPQRRSPSKKQYLMLRNSHKIFVKIVIAFRAIAKSISRLKEELNKHSL